MVKKGKFKRKNCMKGFTIIELVMVITLVGITAGIGIPLMNELMGSLNYTLNRKDLSESADSALRRMIREIPRLQDDTSVYIANAAAYRFIDIDGNTLQFALNGTDLERYDGVNTDILAADVSSFSFTYLDDSMSAIATPQVNPGATDIKFIDINITLTSGNNSVVATTRLRIRNVIHPSDLFS